MKYVSVALCCIGLFAGAANASIIFEIEQVGDDIVISSSGGSINLESFSYSSTGTFVIGNVRVNLSADGSNNALYMGTGSADLYNGGTIENPDITGIDFSQDADSTTGSWYGIYFGNDIIFVPEGYASGDILSDSSATYNSTELASWGLSGGDSYTWTWGSGDIADFATIQVVPEPATLGLMSLFGVGALMTRRFFTM